MASKKRRKKARSSKSAPQSSASFAVGESVRVRAGDFGNSVGEVEGVRGSKCAVRIGREVHEFDAVNLERGGPKDRF